MTSAQTMQDPGMARFSGPCRTGLALLAALTSALSLSACDFFAPKLHPPGALAAPYHQRQVWAVAPFTNESGVSVVAGDRIADAFTAEAEAIDGIDTIPVNRVIAAMRRLNMPAVNTPAQARTLLNTLGADGLIVGTVTVYDPYQPPKFGAAIALFTGEAATAKAIDPVRITRAATDDVSQGAMPNANAPSSQASGIFDAANHQTLTWLNDYSAGRSPPDGAFGERIYLYRMDLYTQFAAYRLLHDLLDGERARLLPEMAGTTNGEVKEPASSR